MVMVAASTRVETRNLKGLVAETSIASICSVTRMEPSSAPILEPTLPAAISPVSNGARVRSNAIPTNEGSHEVAPNSDKDGRDCLVNTIPVMKPVVEISNAER
ncbi:hypothetical protein D3C87_1211900 [compost metagenome]